MKEPAVVGTCWRIHRRQPAPLNKHFCWPVFQNRQELPHIFYRFSLRVKKQAKMESIKHKMECLVKEKDEAVERADEAEKIGSEFEKEASRFEKEVLDKT